MLIRLECHGQQVLANVTCVARCADIEEMFDHEDVAPVKPTACADQMVNIRYFPQVKHRSTETVGGPV